MTGQLQAELLNDLGAVLGEGPTWDVRTDELVCVDILSGRVHLFDEDGRHTTTYEVGGHVGAVLPAAEGGWLIVDADGFALLGRDGSVSRLLEVEEAKAHIRFNDAKCDPWGQALAGTMRYDQAPGDGILYRLAADPSGDGEDPPRLVAQVLVDGVGLSNGLGWTAGGDTLYFIDTPTGIVSSFPYDPEAHPLRDRRDVVVIDSEVGRPDGMCVDHDGNLWVALFGQSAVHCYQPDGTLEAVVSVGAPNVTSVAFGGKAGDRLFITTQGGDGQPRGDGLGGLWCVEPGVTGPPPTPWQRPRAGGLGAR